MGDGASWGNSDWFSIVQTVGIIGSLLLAGAAARREAKAREIENLLTVSEHHRELWSGVAQRKDLERIFAKDVDLVAEPPTMAEQEFLSIAIVHYRTGWTIAKTGGIVTLRELAADVRGFFSLPLPRAVWEKTKSFRNLRFVRFIERAMADTRS